MNIVFYVAPMSSATPVACALNELEVPHERVLIDLAAQDQKKPEFLRLNPNGQVPTLVVDGTPLFESLAIMQWLGDRFGVAKGLWPAADSPRRLGALSWTAWAYVSFGANLRVLNFASSPRVEAALHNAATGRFAMGDLQRQLAILDGQLAKGGYLLGDTYSLADLVVSNVVTYGTLVGVSVDEHAHVKRWLEACQSRPAIAKEWS